MASYRGFDLHFLINNDVERVFMYLLENSYACWTFSCVLWGSIYSYPLPMFKLSCLFIAEFQEFSVYF